MVHCGVYFSTGLKNRSVLKKKYLTKTCISDLTNVLFYFSLEKLKMFIWLDL